MTTHPLEAMLGIAPASAEAAAISQLMELARVHVGGDEGSLLVLDDDANELVFAATAGHPLGGEGLLGSRVPLAGSLSGLAFLAREVQIGAPVFEDEAHTRRVDDGGAPSAVIAAPVHVAGEPVGVLTAVCFEPGRSFDGVAGTFYGRVAAIVGVIVDRGQRIAAARGMDLPWDGLSGTAPREMELVEAVNALTRGDAARLDRTIELVRAATTLSRG